LEVTEGGALEGWGGGSFRVGSSVIGWEVKSGLFWIHSFRCGGGHSAAALVQATRNKARSLGFSKVFWQVVPETGAAMLKTLAKGRAKIDYIQMFMEV
jgi:hypothetical protein